MFDDKKTNVERITTIEEWFKNHKFLPEKIGKILLSFAKMSKFFIVILFKKPSFCISFCIQFMEMLRKLKL